jgi:2-polyprenyl-3-methyl-5-hydroxy-6-metoxy-1,4-benzoquinol methylase
MLRAMAASDRDRWDARYAHAWPADLPREHWLERVGLPSEGPALDVAAGRGALACFLARRGLSVTAVDVSPRALELAQTLAQRSLVTLSSLALDLSVDPPPEGPFVLITCMHYLDRALWPALATRLSPGGLLAFEIATRRNLERHAHPSTRFLLEAGELSAAIAKLPELELIYAAEDWFDDQHVARVVSRRVLGRA